MLAFTLLIGNPSTSYAHGVLSKEIEPGKIRFAYDNDSPVTFGYVAVMDKEGKEIAVGQTDAEGLFDYSKYEEAADVSISDTHGHLRTHRIGATSNTAAEDHAHVHHQGGKTPIVIAVVVVLFAVAAVFYAARRQ